MSPSLTVPNETAEGVVLRLSRALAGASAASLHASSAVALATDLSRSLATVTRFTSVFEDSALHRVMSGAAINGVDRAFEASQLTSVTRAIARLSPNAFDVPLGGAVAAALAGLGGRRPDSGSAILQVLEHSMAALAGGRFHDTSDSAVLHQLARSLSATAQVEVRSTASQVAQVMRLTADMLPRAPLYDLIDAVSRVRTDLVGAAALAVGAAFPSQGRLAVEAAAALASLGLGGEFEDRAGEVREPLLVSSVAQLQHAVLGCC